MLDVGYKVYKDTEGKPISLFALVCRKPNWAVSRIREGEKAALRVLDLENVVAAQAAEIAQRNAEYDTLSNIVKQYSEALDMAIGNKEE